MIRTFLRRLDPGAAILWICLIGATISHFWPSPAHATTHPDKPLQQTSPVATKQPCTKYVVASVVYVGKDGKLHTAIVVIPNCE